MRGTFLLARGPPLCVPQVTSWHCQAQQCVRPPCRPSPAPSPPSPPRSRGPSRARGLLFPGLPGKGKRQHQVCSRGGGDQADVAYKGGVSDWRTFCSAWPSRVGKAVLEPGQLPPPPTPGPPAPPQPSLPVLASPDTAQIAGLVSGVREAGDRTQSFRKLCSFFKQNRGDRNYNKS